MNENCPICGLDVCTKEDPQCQEYWHKLATTPNNTTWFENNGIVEQNNYNLLDSYIESPKIPSIGMIAELCLNAPNSMIPLLVEDLESLTSFKKYPEWLEPLLNALNTGEHSVFTATKALKISVGTPIRFFTYHNLGNIWNVIAQSYRVNRVLALEGELNKRVFSGKSDNLLMFALKKEDPSYRDNHQVIVNNNINSWDIEVV